MSLTGFGSEEEACVELCDAIGGTGSWSTCTWTMGSFFGDRLLHGHIKAKSRMRKCSICRPQTVLSRT